MTGFIPHSQISWPPARNIHGALSEFEGITENDSAVVTEAVQTVSPGSVTTFQPEEGGSRA